MKTKLGPIMPNLDFTYEGKISQVCLPASCIYFPSHNFHMADYNKSNNK